MPPLHDKPGLTAEPIVKYPISGNIELVEHYANCSEYWSLSFLFLFERPR
jgi:hypothetical protein